MSLEIVDRAEYVATNKGFGAMEYTLEQIASGKLNKAQCVALALAALELLKKFERERGA